jgi:hypothetical protein
LRQSTEVDVVTVLHGCKAGTDLVALCMAQSRFRTRSPTHRLGSLLGSASAVLLRWLLVNFKISFKTLLCLFPEMAEPIGLLSRFYLLQLLQMI